MRPHGPQASPWRIENRGVADASYLVIGTRNAADIIHYPHHDLITHKDGATRRYTRADGITLRKGMR
jgi:uncharacterized cupin superfamily protein